MKQQLLEDRGQLVSHLEAKIAELRRRRQEMGQEMYQGKGKGHEKEEIPIGEHVNIQQYLEQQGENRTQQLNIKTVIEEPAKTRADMAREQQETREKLIKLQEMYNKKRELESIGIYENNPSKIDSMYGRQGGKITKQVGYNKKKTEAKLERDKVIKEELQRVEKFLKQSQLSKKQKKLPEDHYSLLIEDRLKLKVYDALVRKPHLSLVEKEKLLECTFEVVKDVTNTVEKQQMKIFLLSNPEVCDKFNVTKTEIMRDLAVYQTSSEGTLTYLEFYQFIKSVEITNRALKPNLDYKGKSNQQMKGSADKAMEVQKSMQKQKQREMERYLRQLFTSLDRRSERIIERQGFEVALGKGLLYDGKKYKYIGKKVIVQLGEDLARQRKRVHERDYYKSLDMKYIGLEEVMAFSREVRKKEAKGRQEEERQDTVQEEAGEQNEDQEEFKEFKEQKEVRQPFQMMPSEQLEDTDFQEYGWSAKENPPGEFQRLKQLDKYYKTMQHKHGSQIHWNGIQHHQEDFTKFNRLIKQMNEDHASSSN